MKPSRNTLRHFWLSISLTSATCLPGCTVLMNYEYFRPSATLGQLMPSNRGLPDNAIVFRGENYQATLYTDPLVSRAKTVGPPLLPVIPAPSIDEHGSPSLENFNVLRVYVTLWVKSGTGEIDFQKATLATTGDEVGIRPVLVERWQSDSHKFKAVPKRQTLAGSVYWPSAQYALSFDLKNQNLSTLETFQFSLIGLQINGKAIPFPVTTFVRTTSANFGSVP